MKSRLFFSALLALSFFALATGTLQFDDHKAGEPELMNEKMELFDEMDNPVTEVGLAKSEIDYFTGDNVHPIDISGSQQEPPNIIIQAPIQTTYGEEDENGHQLQHSGFHTNTVPPQVTEIEETHDYLVQHDLVLDLHNQHLTAAYNNLNSLEAQFIALADELDSKNTTLKVDANTHEFLVNFAAHLVYIQDEQVFEHGNPAPPMYDLYVKRLIDFEAIVSNDTSQSGVPYEERYSESNIKAEDLTFSQETNPNIKARKTVATVHKQWRIKSDLSQPDLNMLATQPSQNQHKTHTVSVNLLKHNRNRMSRLVEIDSGYKYPAENDRNPWSKTRFNGYIRPKLHDSFTIDNIYDTNSTLDDIIEYYNSSYALMGGLPSQDNDTTDTQVETPETDLQTYQRLLSYSQVGYFVLEQIWNELNQLNTDFHTIPNNHLNSIAFYGMKPLHDRIRCALGNDRHMLYQFDERMFDVHREFREYLGELTDAISSCEDDVFAILSITEFYRNYKGDTSPSSPEFQELLEHVKEDAAQLTQLKEQAIDGISRLQLKLDEFWRIKDHFLAALEVWDNRATEVTQNQAKDTAITNNKSNIVSSSASTFNTIACVLLTFMMIIKT